MVIQKYTQNLYASEVYREFERQAVRAGKFDPTPEEIVKAGAFKIAQAESINQPIDVTPSNDLVNDVVRLAYAMRRKGFVNYAEELETKLVLYKQAESALYNITPDTNMDLVHFSHRDGDVDIIEGAGELGAIETIESAAAKIRAVTLKEPTGKLPARNANLQRMAAFIRKGQISGMGDEVEATESTETSQAKDLEPATKQVKDLLKGIAQGFQEMKSVNFDDAMTTFLHGQSGKSSVFNTLGGNQYSELDKYGRMYKAAYRGGKPEYKTIYNLLQNNNVFWGNKYLQEIGVNEKLANKIKNSLVKSGQTSIAPPISPDVKNPYGTSPVPTQPAQSTTETAQANDLKEQVAIRVDTLIKEQQFKVQPIVDKVNAELEKRKNLALKVASQIEQMSNWNTGTLRDARNFMMRVRGSISEINGVLANVSWILNSFGKQSAVQSIGQNIKLLGSAIKVLSDKIGNVSGANIPHTHGRLSDIRNKLNIILDKNPEDQKAKRTLSLVNKMIKDILANQAKGEKAILDAIQGGYKTWQDFDVDTIELAKMVNADAGSE